MTQSRRPRVLMLACQPFPTGQGSQVMLRDLTQMLQTEVAELTLISYRSSSTPTVPFRWLATNPIGIGKRAGPSWRKPIADGWLLAQAIAECRARTYDVIHAHNVEALAVGLLLRSLTHLPLVYHAHTAMAPELPSYFSRPQLRTGAAAVGRIIDATLPRQADAVVVFDERQRHWQAQQGVDPARLHVIPASIDPTRMPTTSPAHLEEWRKRLGTNPLVLYAGNPDGYQNLPLLLDAFAHVRATKTGATLVLASEHPPESFVWLWRPGSTPAGVLPMQLQRREDLAALLTLARVGVSPRVMPVGAPIKVLTYLAAGLPVVACREGAPGFWAHAQGQFVDATPEAFAHAVLQTLGTIPTPRPSLPTAYDVRAQAPRYRTLYAELTARPSPTTR